MSHVAGGVRCCWGQLVLTSWMGLRTQVVAPAGDEGVVPALRLARGWGDDAHRPAGVVSVSQTGAKRTLEVLRCEPLGQLVVGGNELLQAAGESLEEGSSVMRRGLGWEGLLVIYLPKQEKRHAGLPEGGLCGSEVGVGPYPQGQVFVDSGHVMAGAGRTEAELFLGFSGAAPGWDIHGDGGLATPVHQGVVAGGGEGWVADTITGEVAHDFGEGTDAGGERGTGSVAEDFVGDTLEEFHQLLSGGSVCWGARGGLRL